MTTFLSLPGVAGAYASAPDSAALSITGDIDIRIRLQALTTRPAANKTLLGKWAADGSLAYMLEMATNGALVMWMSSTGSFANQAAATSSTVLSSTALSMQWIRVTRAVSGGGVNFYSYTGDKALPAAADFTLLGTQQTLLSGTSIPDTTAVLEIGTQAVGTLEPLNGLVYRVQIYNGIDGTLAFDANFSNRPGKVTSFSESSSNAATVTINGTALITSNTQPNNYQFISVGDGMSVSEKIR